MQSKHNQKKGVKCTISTPDTHLQNWRSERDSNPNSKTPKDIHINNLQEEKSSNLPKLSPSEPEPKSGKNSHENRPENCSENRPKNHLEKHPEKNPDNNSKLVEAILTINKLPLTDFEKADMIRLLLE